MALGKQLLHAWAPWGRRASLRPHKRWPKQLLSFENHYDCQTCRIYKKHEIGHQNYVFPKTVFENRCISLEKDLSIEKYVYFIFV